MNTATQEQPETADIRAEGRGVDTIDPLRDKPGTANQMDRDVLRGDKFAHAVPAENARKAASTIEEDGSVSHAGAGESPATNSHSRAYSSRLSDSAGEIVPSSPISPAPHSPRRDMSAYSLFLLGHDTFSIAKRLGITEARAHKRITLERDRLNGTRTEFEGQLP